MANKKPLPRYRSRVDYDFLKYIRIAFKWATDNHDLTRPEVELLLYLYGCGAFSSAQFNEYHKTLGLYAVKTKKAFEREGWIKLWRNRTSNHHKLYTLTEKGKRFCNLMHKYCAGLEEIPLTERSNKMLGKDKPRINNYYLDIIKKMNKDKAPSE